MMNHLKLFAAVTTLLFMLGCIPASGQYFDPDESQGRELRAGFSIHLNIPHHNNFDSFLESFNHGESTQVEPGFGGMFELPLSDRFALISHISFVSLPASWTVRELEGKVLIPSGDTVVVVDHIIELGGDVVYDLWELDLAASLLVLKHDAGALGVSLGPSVGIVSRLDHSAKRTLVAPEAGSFESGSRVQVLAADEPIQDRNSPRISLRGGLFYSLGVFDSFQVRPGVYFDKGLTSVVKNTDWTVDTWRFQVDLSFVVARI